MRNHLNHIILTNKLKRVTNHIFIQCDLIECLYIHEVI